MKFLISKYLALILLQKKNIIPFRNFTPTSDILQKKKTKISRKRNEIWNYLGI